MIYFAEYSIANSRPLGFERNTAQRLIMVQSTDQRSPGDTRARWQSDTSSPARSPILNAQCSIANSYWHGAGIDAARLGRRACDGAGGTAALWRAGAGAARSGAAVCALDHAALLDSSRHPRPARRCIETI